MALTAASEQHPLPSPEELRALLDGLRPATVLGLLGGTPPIELAVYKAEALIELDRFQEANDLLSLILERFEGDTYSQARRLWSHILLHLGWFDSAILSAERAARTARSEDSRAIALSWQAMGYAYKHCWNLAEATLREAFMLAPAQPRLLVAQARIRLQADQRLEARSIYERLSAAPPLWAKAYADWGRSYVAYLLGEFDQAQYLAERALGFSQEIIHPLFVLSQVALARGDKNSLEQVLALIRQRSPQADSLDDLEKELSKLQERSKNIPGVRRRRLAAFPTMVQRRDYCGPSTVELVLRYWRGGLDMTNDQIAQMVKHAQSGTPIYRMREFFHLVGFDTVRPLAPLEKLKRLIDAGYPIIVQEEFANSSHVAVVIGYDDLAGTIELQDPMTHAVVSVPTDELDHARRSYLDSALLAFPRGQGHDKVLSRLGLFDHPVVVSTDQAVLALDEGRLLEAVQLMEDAIKKLPSHALSWILLLHARLELWQSGQRAVIQPASDLPAHLGEMPAWEANEARDQFYATLERARFYHPGAEFIYQYEGNAALLDGDLSSALAAFQQACTLDSGDARNYARLAECYYASREMAKAYDSSCDALRRDPVLPLANVWMARCAAGMGREHADHYARVGVELEPDWWMAHLALAEALYQQGDLSGTRREADLALTQSPGQPEIRVLRGQLMSVQGDAIAAVQEYQAILEGHQPLNPITLYKACQEMCQLSFGVEPFELALQQASRLLESFPDDPWGRQFQASAYAEVLIHSPKEVETESLCRMQELYEGAISVNNGALPVIKDYLYYLRHLTDVENCLQVISSLRQSNPDQDGLIFLQGEYLAQADRQEEASHLMLTALHMAGSIQSREDLHQAVLRIVEGLGPESGEQELMAVNLPEGGITVFERTRALGLVLALFPNADSAKVRELLHQALAAEPEDALITLRLGDVAQTEEEREHLYRQALILSPRWSLARANLVDYLLDHGRPEEGLEFSSGHQGESLEILTAHARALSGVGQYEKSAEAFEQVIRQIPEPVEWMYENIWSAELHSGWHEAALETARKGKRLFKDNPSWDLRLATTLRESDRLDEALRVLQKARNLSESDRLRAHYEILMARQDLTGALDDIHTLLALQSETPDEGRLGWAKAQHLRLLVEMNLAEEAWSLLEGENLNADGWGDAAWIVMQTRAHEFTYALAERALAKNPGHYAGLTARSEALCNLGSEAEAMKTLRRLREAYPREHHTYEKLALRYAVQDRLDESLELADRAVELGAFCPIAWATRGLVHFFHGQLQEAVDDLQMAWNRADFHSRRKFHCFWYLKAALEGDPALAVENLNKALEEVQTKFDQSLLRKIDRLVSADQEEYL